MKLGIYNVWTTVEEADAGELSWLRATLSVRVKRARGQEGDETFLQEHTKPFPLFPTGWLRSVQHFSQAPGAPKTEIVDYRKKPCVVTPVDLSWLFPYQAEAVQVALQRGRGLVQMPTGCLAGDTVIEMNRSGASKKMLLKDLVFKFNGGASGFDTWDLRIPTRVRVRADDGSVRLHRLLAAVHSGVKTVFEVCTESGHKVRASADHLFLTMDGWKRLSSLTMSDRLYVDRGVSRGDKPAKSKPWYRLIAGLRAHPNAGRKGVKPGKGGYSVPVHRLVVEAHRSGLPFDEFVARVRSGRVAGLSFLHKEEIVHHLDGNTLNNTIGNLEVLSQQEHATMHGKEGGWRHVTATTSLTKITRISEVGPQPTYDLAMDGEPHNFLANGIVVHNSGKASMLTAVILSLPCPALVLIRDRSLIAQLAS
jgi:hypothetical protein